MDKRIEVTAEDGRAALRGHLVDKAHAARERHPVLHTPAGVEALLADRQVVRFPVSLTWSAAELLPGEFAWPRPRGERLADGYDLIVHPCFRDRPAVLSMLVAYHVPGMNYLDVAGREEAEIFGAALHGLSVDDYYRKLCALVDGMPAPRVAGAPGASPPEPPAAVPPDPATAAPPTGGGCGSGHCGCRQAAATDVSLDAARGPSSALVALLAPEADLALLGPALATRAGLSVGALQGRRLPLALQAADAEAAEAAQRWIARLPGVLDVTLVASGLPDVLLEAVAPDDDAGEAPSAPAAPGPRAHQAGAP